MTTVDGPTERQDVDPLQAPSSRQRPTAFVVSPPPTSRLKHRYQKENRNPINGTVSRRKANLALNFEFDHDPVNYDESLPIIESLKNIGVSCSEIDENCFPIDPCHPLRRVIAALIKRIAHLNQLTEETMYENSTLKDSIYLHKEKEMSLQLEVENQCQIIYTLKEKLGATEKEQKLSDKKAKMNFTALEKKFNAIRFKDKQYNNELRKRELECEKMHKKLRSVLASNRTGNETPSLRSSFQKQTSIKSNTLNLKEEVVLLRENNHRMDKRWRDVNNENNRLRDLFNLIVSVMQTTVYNAEQCLAVPDLPLEISGEHLEAAIIKLIEQIQKLQMQDTTTSVGANTELVDSPESTIRDLKQIIKQQQELIRRTIFKGTGSRLLSKFL